MNEYSGISVSELNLLIAEAIRREPRIRSVTVRGEVSSFRHYLSSGHWYFSLKDTESSVSCVMFRQNTSHAKLKPRDGDRIIVSGYVDVYPKNGTYQLYAMNMRPDGTGDLFQRFEELKQRLYAEGLFDPSRKKILPMVPKKVAVITSENGAALHDILNVSRMRNPGIPIVLIPATVQGDRAAAEIASGIRAANEQTDADVIIVARGGGSAEDLWCFNEEIIVRTVAGSRIPVVSGVGHEIDTTICDLAADVRASTPSNAAEIVFPERKSLQSLTDKLKIGLIRAAEGENARYTARVKEVSVRLAAASPETRIVRLTANNSLCRTKLGYAIENRIRNAFLQTEMSRTDLTSAICRRTDSAGNSIALLREHLEAISPLLVLERGYALVSDRAGRILTRTREAEETGNIRIRFADGSVEADIKKKQGAYDE